MSRSIEYHELQEKIGDYIKILSDFPEPENWQVMLTVGHGLLRQAHVEAIIELGLRYNPVVEETLKEAEKGINGKEIDIALCKSLMRTSTTLVRQANLNIQEMSAGKFLYAATYDLTRVLLCRDDLYGTQIKISLANIATNVRSLVAALLPGDPDPKLYEAQKQVAYLKEISETFKPTVNPNFDSRKLGRRKRLSPLVKPQEEQTLDFD